MSIFDVIRFPLTTDLNSIDFKSIPKNVVIDWLRNDHFTNEEAVEFFYSMFISGDAIWNIDCTIKRREYLINQLRKRLGEYEHI